MKKKKKLSLLFLEEKAEQMESHWFLLKPLEHWGCRVNCHPEVWKDWQVQRVIAKMWLQGAEESGALNGGNTHLSGHFEDC